MLLLLPGCNCGCCCCCCSCCCLVWRTALLSVAPQHHAARTLLQGEPNTGGRLLFSALLLLPLPAVATPASMSRLLVLLLTSAAGWPGAEAASRLFGLWLIPAAS